MSIDIKKQLLEKLMNEMSDLDISRFKPSSIEVELEDPNSKDDMSMEEHKKEESIETPIMEAMESPEEQSSEEEEYGTEEHASDFMKAVMAAKKKMQLGKK